MEDMESMKILTYDGLVIYDQNIKEYIQRYGITLEQVQSLIETSDKNTTYTLTKNDDGDIVLTGSDGTEYKVSENEKTNNEIFSDIQPSLQNEGDVWTKFL